MKTSGTSLSDLLVPRKQVKQAQSAAVRPSLSLMLLSGMRKNAGVSFGGVGVVGRGGRPTVLNPGRANYGMTINPGGTSRGTVLNPGGMSRGIVLNPGRANRGTVLNPGGTSRGTVLNPGGTSRGTVLNPGMASRGTVINPRMPRGVSSGSMPKLAQYAGSAGAGKQHRYAKSIAEAEALRRREAAQAAQRQAQAKLPDDQRRRELWSEYAKTLPIKQRRSMAETKRIADADGPTRSWGDNTAARWASGIVSLPVHAVLGLGDYFYRQGKAIYDWARDADGKKPFWSHYHYNNMTQLGDTWAGVARNYGDTARDTANNFQLQYNGIKNGIGQVGRFVARYGDPRNYGDSVDAKRRRLSLENDAANAEDLYHERQSRVLDQFKDPTLRNAGRDGTFDLGALNYGLNAAVGEFTGGELATVGIGGAAKGVGKGITAGTKALGGFIRGADAAADIAAAASKVVEPAATWGGRMKQYGGKVMDGLRYVKDHPVRALRHRAASAVEHVGDAAAVPFRAVGTVAAPYSTGRMQDPLTANYDRLVRGGGQAVTDIVNTGKAGFDPLVKAYRYISNPAAREAYKAYVKAHPWRTLAYPGRWAWNTVTPLGRYPVKWTLSPEAWKNWSGIGAAYNAAGGDWRGSWNNLKEYGKLGLYGPLYTPLWAWDLATGGSDGGE